MPVLEKRILVEVKEYLVNNPCITLHSHKIEEIFEIQYKDIQREFRRYFGVSIKEFHNNIKCRKLLNMISIEQYNISHTTYGIAVDFGFSSDSGLQNFTKRRFENKTFCEIRKNPARIKKVFCERKCERICDLKDIAI